MDFPVVGYRKNKKKILYAFLIVLVILIAIWLYASSDKYLTIAIKKNRVDVNEVVVSPFVEDLSVRGVAVPVKTKILDLNVGGRIVALNFEEGDTVNRGDVIAELENSKLRLDITAREAQVSEQINNLRNTRLAMEKESLSIKQEVERTRYELEKLKRKRKRYKKLVEKQFVSEFEANELEKEIKYLEGEYKLLFERKLSEREFRKSQVNTLESTVERLEAQMNLARLSLEDLNVKAPMNGIISSMDVELGEQLNSGDRLGVIDSIDGYNFSSFVAEHYVNRFYKGMLGSVQLEQESKKLDVIVEKIFPSIENGKFEIICKLAEDEDEDEVVEAKLKRGQSVNLRLELDRREGSIVVAKKFVYEVNGRYWVYLLNEETSRAVRNYVLVGRKGIGNIQILDGLKIGQKVVTFLDDVGSEYDVIEIKKYD